MRSKDKESQQLVKVGARIRSLREKAGLRQEDVEDYGVSWKHYQKIEAGTTNATIRILYRLAKAFRCKAGDLLP